MGPRILSIDLSTGDFEVQERRDLTSWLGGSGLATALMEERTRLSNCVDSDLPVILTIGPMTFIYPVVTKAVAVFRSPLTGEFGESHAGMRLGLALRFAGYDGVVINGKASRPTYLVINSAGVKFKSAGPLWGTDTEECGRILREREKGRGHRSCLRIGQAGERRIRFAGVNVDTYRHFGRLGLGAVFGEKLLKAIVVQGDHSVAPMSNFKEYNKMYKEIYSKVINTDLMEKYHGLGTAGNVKVLNELRSLPTRNLQASTFEAAEELSGEAFAQSNLLRKLACAGCPIGCIHLALLRKNFGAKSEEYEFSQIAYDHELLYALGSMLGIHSRDELLTLIQQVERAGLDAMSTGVALAWAVEAMETGLLSEDEVKCKLSFGDLQGFSQAVNNLVSQEDEFYRDMAQGAEALARKYGGRDFALTLGGNEAAGYHTGYANIVGQALGARHSHLDNAGYSFDQEKEQVSLNILADKLVSEEIIRNTLSSLGICLFARKVYDLPTVVKALRAIGLDWDEQSLTTLGTKIFVNKRVVKQRFGFNPAEIRVPRRFFQTPSYNGMLEREKLEDLLQLHQQKSADLMARVIPTLS